MYELIVRPEGDEFRAICPQVPGVSGRGATPGTALDAALTNLAAALTRRDEPAPTLEVVRASLQQAERC